MNILIVYATTEGQTRKIAEFLKAEAEKLKHQVTLCDATIHPVRPGAFDAILIGASIHSEKYPASIQDYIHQHKQALNQIHSGFLSVSLTAATEDEQLWEELKKATVDLLKDGGWKPRLIEYAAGALLYTQYDFFKKFIVRLIAKKANPGNNKSNDREYTDWGKMSLFLQKFIDSWVPRPITVQQDVSDQEAVG